jgi:hypothetical protein
MSDNEKRLFGDQFDETRFKQGQEEEDEIVWSVG